MAETKQAELRKELAAMNAEWDAITAKRKAWMDEHMADFAKHPIGTEVYTWEGKYVGKVIGYYRYHRDDPRYDTSIYVHYYLQGGGNTSSDSLSPEYLLDAQELADRFERRAVSLRAASPEGR